ncbi:PhoD-like phosphatase-domain-containing protein [Cantharellus anzutake]|uniref:PhoD-like phosphatase-domain-containing protein n=1 Tax=Cantharellus anzutake TaxID=1750568 RepID=UPI0019062789|nr:PhoD-like phosphatase-domain-containing protein [Cantharellus anzutake]KAF8334191.1 PhoD-like phosphatase-domain-containing protein [Cantharellus anzutake]
MPTILGAAQTASSVLLRLGTYIFLRIIPGAILSTVLPILFLVYLFSFTVEKLVRLSGRQSESESADIVDAKYTQDGAETKLDATDVIGVTVKTVPSSVTISTILFNLPTLAPWAKAIGFLINLACIAMVADFVARPFYETHEDLVFTRVGAVYHDAAKIVVRYPRPSEGLRIVWKQMDGTGMLAYSDSDESGWVDGPSLDLKAEDDWVGVTRLDSLWASTRYQYRLATLNSTLLPYPATPIIFRTFPDPRLPGSHFKFIATSCLLPNFPYNPLAPTTRLEGFRLLKQQLDSTSTGSTPPGISIPTQGATVEIAAPAVSAEPQLTPNAVEPSNSSALPVHQAPATETNHSSQIPVVRTETEISSPLPFIGTRHSASFVPTEFMIFMGDFIYADVPYFIGDSRESYNRLYRRTYASEEFRQVYEQLPVLNIYDDHEFKNDFEGRSNDSTYLFANASAAFSTYQGNANYHTYTDASGRVVNYFDFKYGDVAFFILDTRRYRSVTGRNTTEEETPTILGERQLADFHQWAARVNSTAAFKFIISSVPVSALWGGPNGQVDTWAGALEERRVFLDLLEYIPNVIILSGDRHEFAAVEYITGAREFSIRQATPLNQFYIPFFKTFDIKNGQTRKIKYVVKEEVNRSVTEFEIVEQIPEEKILAYLPSGNHKWGTFEVDTTNASSPTVTLELSIDGAKAWTHTIVGKPVKYTGSTALGTQIAQISGSIKGMLGRLGKIFG